MCKSFLSRWSPKTSFLLLFHLHLETCLERSFCGWCRRGYWGFLSHIEVFHPFWVYLYVWYERMVEFHSSIHSCPIFPAPFIGETIFLPPDIFSCFVEDYLTITLLRDRRLQPQVPTICPCPQLHSLISFSISLYLSMLFLACSWCTVIYKLSSISAWLQSIGPEPDFLLMHLHNSLDTMKQTAAWMSSNTSHTKKDPAIVQTAIVVPSGLHKGLSLVP